MALVPLTEWCSVDLNDGGFGEGVGADELVVGGMIHDGDDAGLARNGFGAPGEVTGIEAEGTEFAVAAADTDGVDALAADASRGCLTAFLEGSEIPMLATFSLHLAHTSSLGA